MNKNTANLALWLFLCLICTFCGMYAIWTIVSCNSDWSLEITCLLRNWLWSQEKRMGQMQLHIHFFFQFPMKWIPDFIKLVINEKEHTSKISNVAHAFKCFSYIKFLWCITWCYMYLVGDLVVSKFKFQRELYPSIVPDNVVATTRRHAIIWTSVCLVDCVTRPRWVNT